MKIVSENQLSGKTYFYTIRPLTPPKGIESERPSQQFTHTVPTSSFCNDWWKFKAIAKFLCDEILIQKRLSRHAINRLQNLDDICVCKLIASPSTGKFGAMAMHTKNNHQICHHALETKGQIIN